MCKVSVIVPVYNVENYIYDMLVSVQNQSFRDFEVILVNDGSTDNSQKIIDEFCSGDKRFKSVIKENGGVASARNLGIDMAQGEYVVFYDPDDKIPHDALGKMYKTASSKSADIVIGVMEEHSLGERMIYMHSQKLAKQKKISPLDHHFFGAWSLCHKMFSLQFIRKNNLRIEKLSNAEDGVFTFCSLNCTEKIYGCNTIAYNYIKRPFWLVPSATQTISSKYLEGLLSSHTRILEEANKLADKFLSEKEKKPYLEPLYIRFIEGEMINGYYRNIWRSEENLIPRITEKTAEYRKHISDSKWKELCNRHKDLEFSKGFLTQEEMAENPVVTISISKDIPRAKFNKVLGSLYNQNFPLFEILIEENQWEMLDEIYKNKKNLRKVSSISKDVICSQGKGKYVMFFDQFAMVTKNSLKLMVTKLDAKKDLDFVTMLMKSFDGVEYRQIPVLNANYGYGPHRRKSIASLEKYDTLLCNKLFRKDVFSKYDIIEDGTKAIHSLYETPHFEKLRKGLMITDLSQEDFIRKAGESPSKITVNLLSSKNNMIANFINGAKRHITKEDIDNLKKLKNSKNRRNKRQKLKDRK
jgi:glycosyltransferase involved in cell wall biosynthesis